jgi:hypothetical protein
MFFAVIDLNTFTVRIAGWSDRFFKIFRAHGKRSTFAIASDCFGFNFVFGIENTLCQRLADSVGA